MSDGLGKGPGACCPQPSSPPQSDIEGALEGIMEAVRAMDKRQQAQHQEMSAHVKILANAVSRLFGDSAGCMPMEGAWPREDSSKKGCVVAKETKSANDMCLRVAASLPPLDANLLLPANEGGVSLEIRELGGGMLTEDKASAPNTSPSNKPVPSLPMSPSYRQTNSIVSALFAEYESKKVPVLKDAGWRAWSKILAYNIVHYPLFEYVVGLIIILNSICIGLETEWEINGDVPTALIVTENLFLCLYWIELILRLHADGVRQSMSSMWILFDAVLCLIASFSSWVVEPVVKQGSNSDRGGWAFLEPVMALRIMRMVRLLRALRLLVQFKTLWRLVQGLGNSIGAMVWTCVLLAMTLYVFSCMAVELITKDGSLRHESEQIRMIVDEHFATVPGVMLTLLQFATMDSIAAVYGPIVRARPFFIILFAPILLIISIALMNLVTAVLVEGALDHAKADKDMEKVHKRERLRVLKPEIHEAFRAIDSNSNHTLTKQELQEARQQLPQVLVELMGEQDLEEFFDLLDIDGSGEVEEAEFVEGVSALVLSEVPVETWQILKLLRLIWKSVTHLDRWMARMDPTTVYTC